MDKCREEFQKAFPIPAHWIEFDEKANRYYCPYVADATASTYQSKWVVWQHQQAKVEELEKEWLEMNQQHEQAVKECFKVNSENRKLQKRVDSVTHLIRGLRAEFDLWMDVECPQVERQIELLEQALKGEG